MFSPHGNWMWLVMTIVGASMLVSGDGPGHLYLTVSYCPTAFTGAGAVIGVNLDGSGDWFIQGNFTWPSSEVFGCPVLYDPVVAPDLETSHVYFDFSDDFGNVVELDVPNANVVSDIKVSKKSDTFFGFVNFAVDRTDGPVLLKGVSPAVTQRGECSDGCYEFGQMDPSTGVYQNLSNVLFKAMGEDVDTLYATETYYTQGSHDLHSPPCGPSASDLCLIKLNGKTGETEQSTYTNYSIYQFGYSQMDDSVPSLIYANGGHTDACKNYNYHIANLDLESGEIVDYLSCLDVVDHIVEEPWSSSFSLDNSLLAHATGSTDDGESQIVIYNTNNGSVFDTVDGEAIAKALNSWSNTLLIWSVNFLED